MSIKNVTKIFALALGFVFSGCKGEDTVSNTKVIPPQSVVQPTINIGSTSNFVVLAGSLVSNVPTSAITGNIGLSPAAGSMITGFGGTEITGTFYTVDATGPAGSVQDAVGLTAAKSDLTAAYNDAAGRTSTGIVLLLVILAD